MVTSWGLISGPPAFSRHLHLSICCAVMGGNPPAPGFPWKVGTTWHFLSPQKQGCPSCRVDDITDSEGHRGGW